MSYNHHQHYGQQRGSASIYDEYSEYADIDEPAAAESRPVVFPASHPLFTREEISNTRTLDPYPPTQSPQSWTPSFQEPPLSYTPYPSTSAFPPPRLSPPPTTHHFHFKVPGQSTSPGSASHRPTLAGSLDTTTGIFYRSPEHPRLRTAQACEKCRTRKAKCSGDHPSCKRCITRGLICEYAKEGRVRGPNKPKPKNNATSMASPSASASSTSTVASSEGKKETTPTMTNTSERASKTARHRPPSSHSSGRSSDQTTNEAAGQSLFLPPSVENRSPQVIRGEYLRHQSLSGSPPSSTPISLSRGRRSVIDSEPSILSSSRQNSLGEHHPPRPNQADMHLDTASSLFRLSDAVVGEEGLSRSVSARATGTRIGDSICTSIRDDSGFYHFQSHPQLQQQYQSTHGHGYLTETGLPEQHHPRRNPQQQEQTYQQFHPQRNVFHVSSQYVSTQSPGRDMRSLSRVSMRSGTPHPGAFPLHGNIPGHGEIFRGQQQQQHSLVPIMQTPIPDDSERRHEHNDEYSYTPQPVGSYYHPNEHHGGLPPDRALDSARAHSRLHFQHEYPHAEHQQDHLQHHVAHTQITDQIFQDHRQTQYLDRATYEVSFHGQSQRHVGMAGASPRTTSVTSGSAYDSSSPLTASSSGGIPTYQHHHGPAVTTPGTIHLDPRLENEIKLPVAGRELPSSSSSSSISSVAVLQPYGGQRPADGGDMQHSHGGLVGMDVEQVQHMDIGNAAVHRGNGRGSLSASASLASLGSTASRLGPSSSGSGYAGGAAKGDLNREDDEQVGYSASMNMGIY